MPRRRKSPKKSMTKGQKTFPDSMPDSKTPEEEIPKRDFTVCFNNADSKLIFSFSPIVIVTNSMDFSDVLKLLQCSKCQIPSMEWSNDVIDEEFFRIKRYFFQVLPKPPRLKLSNDFCDLISIIDVVIFFVEIAWARKS